MFTFFFNAIDLIKKIYFNFIENFYDFLGNFGVNITPSHNTRADRSNYQEWISSYSDEILQFLGCSELPSYLNINSKNKYSTISSLIFEQFNHKLFKAQVTIIISKINQYNYQQQANMSFIEKKLSADFDKLNPEKMLLTLIQEFIKYKLIHFNGTEDDLRNITLFVKYLEKLTSLTSIKGKAQLHDLLLTLLSSLVQVKNKIYESVQLTKIKHEISLIGNFLNNTLNNIRVFFYNLFNFNKIFRNDLERDIDLAINASFMLNTPSHKINHWLCAIQNIIQSELNFHDVSLDTYLLLLQHVNKYTFNLLDKTHNELISCCPVLVEVLLNAKAEAQSYISDRWKEFIQIQDKIAAIITLYKLFDYLSRDLEKAYIGKNKASIDDIFMVLPDVKDHVLKFIKKFEKLSVWDALLKNYQCRNTTTKARAEIIGQLHVIKQVIIDSLKEVIIKIDGIYYEYHGKFDQTMRSQVSQEAAKQFSAPISDFMKLYRTKIALGKKQTSLSPETKAPTCS